MLLVDGMYLATLRAAAFVKLAVDVVAAAAAAAAVTWAVVVAVTVTVSIGFVEMAMLMGIMMTMSALFAML
jgi:hypothetical protein